MSLIILMVEIGQYLGVKLVTIEMVVAIEIYEPQVC